MRFIDEPPPSTLPMESGKERPLIEGLGWALKFQSCSPPRFKGQLAASLMLATSSSPPASSNRTFTSGFSARRRATTDPEEPDPHTMKSYCPFNPVIRRSWLLRTRSLNSTPAGSNSTCVFILRTSFIVRYQINDNPNRPALLKVPALHKSAAT